MAKTACAARMPRMIAGATILDIFLDRCGGCCERVDAGDLLPFDHRLLSKEAGLIVTLATHHAPLLYV